MKKKIVIIFIFLPFIAFGKEPDNLKIINWNVLYGFNYNKSFDRGSAWIKEQKPDVLGLQELNGYKAADLAKMAREWGHNYSMILKESGFPVGITSNSPIKLIQRRTLHFRHGFLHVKTHNVNFVVAHLWKGAYPEVNAVVDKIIEIKRTGEHLILMGDFNTHSSKDRLFLAGQSGVETDFGVIDKFENLGLVDVVKKHNPNAVYSVPSPIIRERAEVSLQELYSRRQRIDYIFTDKELTESVKTAAIIHSPQLDSISDHYPVSVELTVTR